MGVSFSLAPFCQASPDGGELFAFFPAFPLLRSCVASFLSSPFLVCGLRVGWRYEVISQVALLGVPTPASSTALAPESCCIGCILYLALRGCVYCMALQGIHTVESAAV